MKLSRRSGSGVLCAGLVFLSFVLPGCGQSAAKTGSKRSTDEFKVEANKAEPILDRIQETGKVDAEAWRYAIDATNSGRFYAEAWGLLVIRSIVEVKPEFADAARAIYADRAIRASLSGRSLFVTVLSQAEGLDGGLEPGHPEREQESYWRLQAEEQTHLERVESNGKLDDLAKRFVARMLNEKAFGKRLLGAYSLVETSALENSDRAWAADQARRARARAEGNEKTFWYVVERSVNNVSTARS